jgi:alpha-tubulin suppressor-like RCC1 family protein
VEGVEGVSATSCGERHALVLTADGAVYAWGYGAAGTSPPVASSPLGLGDMQPRASPSRVEGLPPRVRGVAACHMHSLAVSEEGQVYSWGHGALGKLGHGDQGRQLKPTLVSELDGVCVASVAGGVHGGHLHSRTRPI